MTEFVELRGADYKEVLATQRSLFANMVEQRGNGNNVDKEYLFIVEHKPVYTLGRHGDKHNLTHAEFLRAQGLDLVEIERGGDITYHGPGQVVAYPLIDMARRSLGVKGYVNLLEEAVIRTIAEYGIRGERVDGATGVWIDVGTPRERKICAIGIKCSRFVTMHGLALNVCTDLSYFSAINPCGFVDKGVTSISAEVGRTVTFDDAAARLRRHLTALLAL
jgi:lipoyl(octanoyl) transferase